MMHAIHAALRRDLGRLDRAASLDLADPDVRAAVARGWDLFKTHLHVHHTAEDTDLWPRLRERLGDQPECLAILAAMEQEHRLIPPALAAVDEALAARDPGRLRTAAAELRGVTESHLSHEESSALPLIERTLTEADWRTFLHEQRRLTEPAKRPVFLTWLLDDAPAPLADAVLAELPGPARLVYRGVLRPRYRRQRRWA